MNLVNVETGEMREFTGEIPRYAILSHRWTENESSHEKYRAPSVEHRISAGFLKIVAFRMFLRKLMSVPQPASKKVEWCWIDMCCIDKRSSAAISEAINSMAQWYRKSAFCVAYLFDVPSPADREGTHLEHWIRYSDWFSRGWTLQELLFPPEIVFCDTEWNALPLEKDSLLISEITKIPWVCLKSPSKIAYESVARRMRWAADRKTTREEDQAYCLLGIFNINMPLLYGEGHKAFFRLQEHILAQSTDDTLFAWDIPADVVPPVPMGCLALSPRYFQDSSFVESWTGQHKPYKPRMMQQKRVGIKGKAVRAKCEDFDYIVIGLDSQDAAGTQCLLVLQQTDSDDYVRVCRQVAGDRTWTTWIGNHTSRAQITMIEEKVYYVRLGEHYSVPIDPLEQFEPMQKTLQDRSEELQSRDNGTRQ